jgi:hypothetical protein
MKSIARTPLRFAGLPRHRAHPFSANDHGLRRRPIRSPVRVTACATVAPEMLTNPANAQRPRGRRALEQNWNVRFGPSRNRGHGTWPGLSAPVLTFAMAAALFAARCASITRASGRCPRSTSRPARPSSLALRMPNPPATACSGAPSRRRSIAARRPASAPRCRYRAAECSRAVRAAASPVRTQTRARSGAAR